MSSNLGKKEDTYRERHQGWPTSVSSLPNVPFSFVLAKLLICFQCAFLMFFKFPRRSSFCRSINQKVVFPRTFEAFVFQEKCFYEFLRGNAWEKNIFFWKYSRTCFSFELLLKILFLVVVMCVSVS